MQDTSVPFSIKDAAIRAIAARCAELVREQPGEDWKARADDLLRHLLPSSDQQLRGLLEQALEQEDDEFVDDLLFRFEQVSTSQRLQLEGRPLVARLLVLPLQVFPGATPVDFTMFGNQVALGQAVEFAVQRLKKEGLVREEARMVGLPRIFSADELANLSFAEVAGLLERGTRAAREGVAWVSEKNETFSGLGRTAAPGGSLTPVTAAGRVLAEPAFIVLLHLDDESAAPCQAPLGDEAAMADFKMRYLDWTLDVAEQLDIAIGQGVLVDVSGRPTAFFEGFRFGVEAIRDLLVLASVSASVAPLDSRYLTDVVAKVVSAKSEPHRVWVVIRRADNGECLGRAVLPVYPWETPEVAVDSVESKLVELGVGGFGEIRADVSGPLDSVQGG